MPTATVRRQAAALLRRLLAAVGDGTLTADTPEDRRALRRIEGAVAALDADAGREPAAG